MKAYAHDKLGMFELYPGQYKSCIPSGLLVMFNSDDNNYFERPNYMYIVVQSLQF